MTPFHRAVALAAFLLPFFAIKAASDDWPDLVLDETVLRISVISAELSALAYEDASDYSSSSSSTGYAHSDYDSIKFYNDEPDQAVVAKKEGRCYVAFRGTTLDLEDWMQNLDLGDIKVYKDNEVSGSSNEYCEARKGYAGFLFTDFIDEGQADILDCISDCDDADDCLVITGHSQGGAMAALAAIVLYSQNPIVVTFGQPPTMDADCPYIDNSRFYRYVNWMKEIGEDNDIGFDTVPYVPTWVSASVHYGYNIMVGEDSSNVYYAGYADDVDLGPGLTDYDVLAHTMSGESYSYLTRLENLYSSLPNVGTTGSVGGTICEDGYMELCQSNSCVENECVEVGGVTETCIKGSCEKDSDCAGDMVCIWDSCATGAGEVEAGCPCSKDSDCENNDCVFATWWWWLSLDWVCKDD